MVRWLRDELAAVETVLTGAHGRRAGLADVIREPDRAG
jgi:hypothetical protein